MACSSGASWTGLRAHPGAAVGGGGAHSQVCVCVLGYVCVGGRWGGGH
jgi:hypothetical protein